MPNFSVQLISDIDETGKKAFYFIKVQNEKLESFTKAATSSALLNIEDFGEVLYSAYGDFPPQHIQKWAKEKLGWQG